MTGTVGHIQGSQNDPELSCMKRIDSRSGSREKELFKTLVPKSFNHRATVIRKLTLVNPRALGTSIGSGADHEVGVLHDPGPWIRKRQDLLREEEEGIP